MVCKVVKTFTDVMGLLHREGESLDLSDVCFAKYGEYVEEKGAKKNAKRKSSPSVKVKSPIDD